MEVKRIKTEGTRINPLRNVERLLIEVEAVGNGCSVEGHKVLGEVRNDDGTFRRQPTRIEIYVDRLTAVLARTRTDKERRVYERACESHQELLRQWMEDPDNRKRIAACKSKEERERFIHYEYSLRPEHELKGLGYPHGLPPIESCKVIHPGDLDKTIDAREWQKLPAEQRAEWLVEAPITPQNASQRATESNARSIEHMAAEIAKAVAAVGAREDRTQKQSTK